MSPIIPLVFSVIIPQILGANILVVFPHVSYTHFRETSKLVTALELNHHNITFVNPYPGLVESYTGRKNITEVSIEEVIEPVKVFQKEFNKNENSFSCYLSKLKYSKELGFQYSSRILHNENVSKLISSDSVFDLVILEDVSADALAIFSYVFKSPLVVLLSEPLSVFYDNYFEDHTDWKQGNVLRNTHHFVIKELYREWTIWPQQNEIIKEILPEAPQIQDVLYDTSLVLMPSFPELRTLVPKYDHVKEIGAFHIDFPRQLPENIERTLNQSQKGVIVLSADVASFARDNMGSFIGLFGKVPQNTLMLSVASVGDILGHPTLKSKAKLVINNGDFYDSAYAVKSGVPLLSISNNRWQQQFLIDKLVEVEAALKLPIDQLEELLGRVNQLIGNKTRYQENAHKMSQYIIENQTTSPFNEAIFWIDYVIKLHGASHLKPIDLHTIIRRHLLWTVVILSAVDILLFLIFYWIIKHLSISKLCCCGGRKMMSKIYCISPMQYFRPVGDIKYTPIKETTE